MICRYLLFPLSLFLLFSCREKVKNDGANIIRPVRVVKMEALGSINKQYTGIVEADEFSILAFKVAGTLTELNVNAGQQVRKGEVIARINPFDYRRQDQTAQANYNVARSIYERTRRLYAGNAAAKQDLEIAEADYIRAKSALSIAQMTLGYTTLTAPFSGFIEQRFVENFEEILVGQAIVRLVNPGNIKVNFILPETSIELLQIPKKIFVEFDTQKGRLFTSEMKEYPYSSDGSGIPVTLTITDEQFAPYRGVVFPGFSCKVIFEIDNTVSHNFIIPSSALLREGDAEYVWIVDPNTNTTQRRQIRTINLNSQILVEEGLNSADLIVIAGAASVGEGQKVSISRITE